MKKQVLGWLCLSVLFLSLPLMALAKPVGVKEKFLIITEPSWLKWSDDVQTVNLPSRDLNADGKKEKLRLDVSMRASSIGYTIYVSDTKGRLLFKTGFSSDGGCYIGHIMSGPRQQIAISEMVWLLDDESHADPHFHNVTVYDWNKNGKLVESYFYRTKQKGGNAWGEFLQNKGQAIPIMGLVATKPSAKTLQTLLNLGLKQNAERNTISDSAQYGPWVILGRYKVNPGATDWNGQIDAWRKDKNRWVNLSYHAESYDQSALANELGIPFHIWRKLWAYFCR